MLWLSCLLDMNPTLEFIGHGEEVYLHYIDKYQRVMDGYQEGMVQHLSSSLLTTCGIDIILLQDNQLYSHSIR